IAMVARRDPEHPQPVEADTQPKGAFAYPRPEGRETGEVDQKEGDGRWKDNVAIVVWRGAVFMRHCGPPLAHDRPISSQRFLGASTAGLTGRALWRSGEGSGGGGGNELSDRREAEMFYIGG